MINDNTSLVLHDLYYYDIVSCYPTILKTQAYDFSNVDLNNKQERSEFIGKQQKDNINMSSYLMDSANSLVTFYLLDNDISEDDIIMTQRDGFILTRPLSRNDNGPIKMELRRVIDFMIITVDRLKYLECSNSEVTVKGMRNLYPRIAETYKKFANLDFYNKKRLFGQMMAIKNYILEQNDKEFFEIPMENNQTAFMTYNGDIAVKDLDLVSVKSINKVKYFDKYIKPFTDSIFLELY